MASKKASTRRQALSITQWWEAVGPDKGMAVLTSAGASKGYAEHLRYHRRRPSYDMALRIIEAAKKATPRHVPDLGLLMEPVIRRDLKPAAKPRSARVPA